MLLRQPGLLWTRYETERSDPATAAGGRSARLALHAGEWSVRCSLHFFAAFRQRWAFAAGALELLYRLVSSVVRRPNRTKDVYILAQSRGFA